MDIKVSLQLFVEQMDAHAQNVEKGIKRFSSSCVYTNAGDMTYLGQMQGDLAGTNRCLVRLREILKES